MSEEFMAADWIDRLARALGHLAKVQEPYHQFDSYNLACER